MGTLDTALKDSDSAMFNHAQGLSDAAEIELSSKECEFIRDVVDACREHPYPLFNWLADNAETPELLAMMCWVADNQNLALFDKVDAIKALRDGKAKQFADHLWAYVEGDSGGAYLEAILNELDLEEYLEA